MGGKTVVVTGATSGIGLATALGLVQKGAYVIGVGRSKAKCTEAEALIKTTAPKTAITFFQADLASQKQIRELAIKITKKVRAERNGVLDVLINNAGTYCSWFMTTDEGFELQFAVNHLAPFLLTHQLLPLLMAAPNGRVISVSSGSHYGTILYWKDLQLRKHYNGLWAYKQSKLANLLFIAELNRRFVTNSTLRAYAADPGLVNTEIGFKNTTGLAHWVWGKRRRKGRRPEDAAATSIFLASDPAVQKTDAIYWKDCKPTPPSRYVNRFDARQRLWGLSEKMCGVKYADYGLGS
ncbi:MAG TPA: SDR family NAD(P)-dependent oxidoreductase [Hydrogenispora sp.]|nr:SDR family NAD(P)-dependent oxidoreductase [Hydrogenispora sp.]